MPKLYRKDYFEAIIQLRPSNKKVVDFLLKQIKDANREDIFISKVVEKKFGIDFYISSQKFARQLGSKLKKRFDGELNVSKTLKGRHKQTGRLLYRATVCFRLKQENL